MATLETHGQDGSTGPGADGPGLGQDLSLLRVRSNQIEHPVVRGFGVLQEGGERRDGLPRSGGGVEEQNPPALDQFLDLVDRAFLARTRSVGEERTDYGGRMVGGRTVTCAPIETRRGV